MMRIIRLFSLPLLLLFIAGCTPEPSGDQLPAFICHEGLCLELEHVITPAERMKGLMGRESVEGGMLFHFKEAVYPGIWMKNMKIPIDIIWLDDSLRVVHLVEDAPPCISEMCEVYKPGYPSLYVLEVASGTAKEYSISVGDTFRFSADN